MGFPYKAWLTAEHDGVPAWRKLLWLVALGLLAVLVGFVVFDARVAGNLIKNWGYYAIAFTFGWWVWSVVFWVRKSRLRDGHWWRARLNGEMLQLGVLIAVLTAVAMMTVPRVYKVLFDEVVIQSTAWNLHMEREVGAVNRAFEVEGLMRSMGTYLDKRPYFFAFLVSLLHDFTGYRESNAFLLNTLLMPVVLGFVYYLGRRVAGHGPGMAAVAALGAFPLLAMNAHGAGLEMLNLAMILGMMTVALVYLEKPDEDRLGVLVLTSILLANTRYESSIYVGCAALIALEGWRRAGRILLPTAGLFAPVLLVPYALHNTYLSGTPALWELRDGTKVRFSFDFLVQNLGYAYDYFFNVKGIIANSPWLTFSGLASLAALVVWGWRKKPQWSDWTPSVLAITGCGLGIVGNVALLMAYYWGDLSDPVVSRLSLPLHALTALVLAGALGLVRPRWRARACSAAIGLAVLGYLLFGVRVNQQLDAQNLVEVSQRWEVDVLKRRGPAQRLVVTNKSPLSWFVRDVPSIIPARISMRPNALPFHLAHHTFDEVLVTQSLSPVGDGVFWLDPEHRVPQNYVLKLLEERRIGAKLHRISVLKEIRVDAPPLDDVSSAP